MRVPSSVLPILLLVAVPLPAAAQADVAAPQPARIDFTVVRKGTAIGTHVITIKPDGAETRVDVVSNIAVKAAFVTVYRFVHDGHETWRDGKLVALTSATNDDGSRYAVSVRAEGGALQVVSNGKPATLDRGLYPASLWHPLAVRQSRLLNTVDGSALAVTVAERGEETVMVRGQPTPARRFSVTGQLQREVWYDRAGALVQVHMKAKDGSEVQFVLR